MSRDEIEAVLREALLDARDEGHARELISRLRGPRLRDVSVSLAGPREARRGRASVLVSWPSKKEDEHIEVNV